MDIDVGGIITPISGVDPSDALATSMWSMPGVYAVLVGSGMSSAAGIPTGWQVVEDLVRRVASSEGIDPDDLGDDPAGWWERQGRPELRYDDLLQEIAPTSAARQGILRTYFEPPPGEPEKGLPTSGHLALAALIARGIVRTVITTNFDRLLERALESVGVSAQVLSSPQQAAGRIPLQHASATLVKVHGDYTSPDLRNTADELRTYPEEWNSLLAQIFDECGLIVIGWSADWDVALSNSVISAPSRRYPTYWLAHNGEVTEAARRVVDNRCAKVISSSSADSFLGDLVERIDRLDAVASRVRRPQRRALPTGTPNYSSAPDGWSAVPRVAIRAYAQIESSGRYLVDYIRPASRSKLVEALDDAAVTAALQGLANWITPAWASEPHATGTASQSRLTGWHLTPGAHQSYDVASYRLGNETAAGLGMLCSVRPPQFGAAGSLMFAMLDIAISVGPPLAIRELAQLMRDGLTLVTQGVTTALADVLPPDASPTVAELHLAAPWTATESPNGRSGLEQRLDLSGFGQATSGVIQQMSFSADIPGPLWGASASEFVLLALEHMALGHGFMDPTRALRDAARALDIHPLY